MTVALLHAYRVANRGDGWLVELSRRLVTEALGTEPQVFALDPAGMGDGAVGVLPGPTVLRAGTTALLASLTDRPGLSAAAMTLPDPADLDAAIGIGGAYLRSNDPVHELVFRAHHLPQLQLLASLGARGGYLPVSVGPFRRGLGRHVRRLLGRACFVAVRDDRSARYLSGWARPQRLPDLAACHIGVARPELAAASDGTVVAALRSLSHSDLGFEAMAELERRGQRTRFALQSDRGRTNDDRVLYADRGVLDAATDLADELAADQPPSVVLAGRLHAALAAIAAGVPTIHLGYERKSAGAFADLGLSDYLVDAWTGQTGHVADLIEAVLDEPAAYWERLASRFDHLAGGWADLVRLVATTGPGS